MVKKTHAEFSTEFEVYRPKDKFYMDEDYLTTNEGVKYKNVAIEAGMMRLTSL